MHYTGIFKLSLIIKYVYVPVLDVACAHCLLGLTARLLLAVCVAFRFRHAQQRAAVHGQATVTLAGHRTRTCLVRQGVHASTHRSMHAAALLFYYYNVPPSTVICRHYLSTGINRRSSSAWHRPSSCIACLPPSSSDRHASFVRARVHPPLLLPAACIITPSLRHHRSHSSSHGELVLLCACVGAWAGCWLA